MPLHNIGADGFCTCRPTEKRPTAWADCPSPGKHPRIKTGRAFEAATTDEAQIRKWWQKWPEANIGIATGQQCRLCVVDVDKVEGQELLRAIAEAHGGLPDTLVSLSGRGGVGAHLWFECTEPSPSNSGHGLDIRGDGGNLVAPPSMHISGRPYAWLNPDQPLAPMPTWLLHWFKNREGEARAQRPAAIGPLGELPAHLRGRAGAGLTSRVELQEAVDIVDIDSALEAIPNADRSWDSWNRVGMAVWRASGGSDAGMEAFDFWSQLSKKYDPEAAGERWRAYTGSPPDSIGYGSLYFEAKQADPSWTPPSQQHPEVIPAEMQAFSAPNPRPTSEHGLNGHALTGSPLLQPMLQKKPDNPLLELNEQFAVIGNIGGKCLVLEWLNSPADKDIKITSFQDFNHFKNRYSSRYIMVTKRKENKDGEVEIIEENKELGAYWLKWSGRTNFESLDLDPAGPAVLPGNVMNLWRGFGVDPKPGGWPLMQRHIFEILASGDAEQASYILKWAAWSVQNPGDPAEVALVFRGGKGTGKGTFGHAMRRLFGQHGVYISNSKHMVGQFNGHLRSCILLLADEAFWAGDKQGESTLKGMLTEPVLMVENKGVDASPWRNRLHVIMLANAEWAVPAGPQERRYAVFDVSSKHQQNETYFDPLRHELDNDGLAAMLHDLKTLDLKGWHPRKVVQTAALQSQKARTLNIMQEWFEGILQEGRVPGAGTAPDKAPAQALLRIAREDSRKMQDVTPTALGRFLSEHGCKKVHEAHGNAWKFPPLVDVRAAWEKAYGGAWQWQEEVSEWRPR